MRCNNSLVILRQRFEILRLRPTQNKRQHPLLPKGGVTSSQSQHIYRKINYHHPYHVVSQNEQIIRIILTRLISHSSVSSRFLSKNSRSQSSIRLGLLVRILPKEERAQGNISNRTRPRIQASGKNWLKK